MTIEEKTNKARRMIEGPNIHLRVNFQKLYPYTTENISGYLPYFKLKDKSLLTVGSSSDQVMNAIKEGCKDITVVDICPFTKEYYELKKAALLTLSLEEFLNFFSYEKKDTSSMKKIEEALSLEESYLFWKSLSTSFPKEKIQKKLFTRDEYPIEVIQKINPYLKDEDSYKKTREEISSISPTFIEGDILRHPYERQFDAIWLSNIFDYKGNQFSARQIHQFMDNLSDEGLLLLYYLYYTSHQEEPIQIEDLYDPKRIIRFFPYDSEFYQFRGIDSYLLKKNHTRDGVIIYQKEKRN